MFRFTDLVIFRMTKACNLNCKYCFMLDRPPNVPNNYIKQEMLERIIDQIIAQRVIQGLQQYELSLVLHGGEVLILGKERLTRILEYITTQFNKYGIHFNLGTQTNGILLDEEMIALLVKYNVSIGMSFDGVGGGNDSRTSVKVQAYEKSFDTLNKYGARYGFIMVASKNNVDTLPESQRYLEALNPSGEYKINYAEDMVNYGTEDSIELDGSEFFERVYKPELENLIKTGITYDSELREMIRDAILDIATDHSRVSYSGCGSKSCGSALHMIAIEPDGDMDICDRFSRKFDDPQIHMMHALDYDFLGIHQIRRALEFHTSNHHVILETGCDDCPADYMCKHGCMSFHYSKHNQQWGLEKNLVCGIYQNLFQYIREHIVELLTASILSFGGEFPIHTIEEIYRIVPEVQQYLLDNFIEVRLDTTASSTDSILRFSLTNHKGE